MVQHRAPLCGTQKETGIFEPRSAVCFGISQRRPYLQLPLHSRALCSPPTARVDRCCTLHVALILFQLLLPKSPLFWLLNESELAAVFADQRRGWSANAVSRLFGSVNHMEQIVSTLLKLLWLPVCFVVQLDVVRFVLFCFLICLFTPYTTKWRTREVTSSFAYRSGEHSFM